MGILLLLLYTAIMGFSIFLVLPVAAIKNVSPNTIHLLNSVAIGILIFLMLDVFMGTYAFVNPNFSEGTVNLEYSVLIIFCILFTYASFSYYTSMSGRRGKEAVAAGNFKTLSFIVAAGIGLQNLTEGLALGASMKLGLSSLVLPIFVGFTIQNITEGFPILTPFLGKISRSSYKALILALFVGGFPTFIGSLLSFFVNSVALVVVFNSVAIGSIIFVMLQMHRMSLKSGDVIPAKYGNTGLMMGLLLAYLVNLLP